MKEREWWIYQKRGCDSPWAIHMFVRKRYRSIRTNTEIYADWIPSESKRVVVGEMSIVQPGKWIDTIGEVLTHLDHPLDDADKEQLENEIREIKLSFKY